MKPKIFIITLLSLLPFCLFAQTDAQKQFIAYANDQMNLQHKAYEARDIKTDKKLITGFVSSYNKLSDDDKRAFKQYLTNTYYNLSCIYSVLNDKKEALDYLDSSYTKGFYDYAHLQEDHDMDNIRHEHRFLVISEHMRSIGDYQYILKKGEKYNVNDQRKVPEFTYEPATDSNLVALKHQYKLDSIAGSATDVTQVLNILHWVHNTVHHDGQHESGITSINAFSIINATSKGKMGVSCGELATVLNDCYLALGYKARKVYCFPKDSLSIDYDSHVINVVYVPSKKKWIWVDPTNNAVVMDENGNLLSIEEVRERIINNKPLILNPDANWNNRQTITKDFYLDYYMAKNLYYLYSPLKSEYNYETRANDKTVTYVNLVPLDYFKQKPDMSENKNKDTNFAIVKYRTNNPQIFWELPN